MGTCLPKTVGRQSLLRLEELEDRIAPAGGITVVMQGGSLIVTGDAENNDFVIDQVGLWEGQYRASSGVDATDINGQADAVIFTGVTKGFNIKLGDGNDTLEVHDASINGTVLIDAGKGDDSVDLQGVWVMGKLTANMKDGDDEVTIRDSLVEGNVTINGGNGYNGTYIGMSDLHGNVVIKGATGNDEVGIGAANVYGGVSIATGNGDLSVYITGSAMGTAGQGHDVKIVNGHGNGDLSTDTTSYGRNLTWTQGPGDFHVNIMDDTAVAGSVQLKTSTGDDNLIIRDTVIDHKLTIITGSGSLAIGIDTVHVGQDGKGFDAKIANGNGPATVGVYNSWFGRSLSISNGNADAHALVVNSNIARDHSYKSGSGADTYRFDRSFAGGKASVNTGAGADDVSFDGVWLNGALSVNAGSGDDKVYLDAYDDPSWYLSTFGGPVSVILGSGDDYLASGVGGEKNGAIYQSRVFVNGGSGSDTIDYLTGDNTFASEPTGVGIEFRM